MQTFLQDLRYGARMFVKQPGFTLVAIVTLSLGIGANTAIFSIVNGVLLAPLPYRDGQQLVVLKQQAILGGGNNLPFSVKEISDYRERNHSLEGIVEYHSMSFILLGHGEPERVRTGVVSAEFFDFLGVRPLLGRTFRPGEDLPGAEPVLVLSYEYWQRSHGGDPNIVGKTFRMNDKAHYVVGVLPPFPQYPNENDVYMAVSSCPFRSAPTFIANRNARMMSVFGRLRPGATVTQAQADLKTIAGQLQQAYPESYPPSRGYGATLAPLQEELTRAAKPTMLILLGTTGLVLLIACANVANLALARLLRRERELAIRAALGAGRRRLIRQLVTESTLLALAGGGLGLLLAASGLDLLKTFAARFTPRASEIHIDAAVLLFTLVVSVGVGVTFGALPALAAGENLVASLKEGSGQSMSGKGRQRLRSLLIVSQVAMAFVLLMGAGLMVRSLLALQRVDGGFKAENVLTMQISLNFSKYNDAQKTRAFFNALLERIRMQPGVISAAVAFTFPLNQSAPRNSSFQIEGRPVPDGAPVPLADLRVASPDYFQTVGIPLLRGRTFTAQDHENAMGVALINQTMARHRWGNDDPVGHRVSLDNGQRWLSIVGVIGDVRQYGLDQEPADELYLPFAQAPNGSQLLARMIANPSSMARQMTEAVYSIDPDQPVSNVQTLEQVRRNSLASPRLTAMLLSLFAALALTITATGITGVLALWVNQRAPEIGIRMALGATPGTVLRMVLTQGMRLVVLGLLLGLAGAAALTRWMTSLLFGISTTDPATFALIALLLLAVALLACYFPARHATKVDPLVALRNE
jgi:putative ABC transport system permease protein